MKISKPVLLAIIGLIAWCLIAWFIGLPLHLPDSKLLVLRIGLIVLGVIAFVAVLVWHDATKPKTEPAAPATAAAHDDLDFIFREASHRLRASNINRGELLTLVTVFVLGEPGSAKTTIIARSGSEPELLAGHAYSDNVVAPTPALNLWLSKNVLFVDPAGKLISDPVSRRRLFHHFGPVGLRNVLRSAPSPPRAVVLTFDVEIFFQPGASEQLSAKARALQNLLAALCQELGASLPVYVLFTKADRILYFREWAETLTENEASEVLGAAIPPVPVEPGVYSEQQSRLVANAFQQLYLSLSDKRKALLAREHDAAKLPNIYEFSREFGKIRSLLVQFLVDLFRPSQLQANPYLRGFYFTGVRPVVIQDPAPSRAPAPKLAPDIDDAGATRVFVRQSAPPFFEPSSPAARRVPQWVFLQNFFASQVLGDTAALGSARSSIKVNYWRRFLFIALSCIAIILAAAWTGSYFTNRNLLNSAIDSAAQLPQTSTGDLPILDSLQRLEAVRSLLDTIDRYADDGPPLYMRFGLYTGNDARASLREIYYDSFRRLLLGPTQHTLIAICSQPPKSADVSSYHAVYDALKAYLITTSHHEKATRDFLSPVLVQNCLSGRPIDSARLSLAQRQFDFYSSHLAESNPYPHAAVPDSNAIATARLYLNQFGYQQRVYQVMLADAAKQNPVIVFNQMFPGSAEVILNGYRVSGAFSKNGYTSFQKELQDPDKYLAGEEWVLGPASNIPSNKAELVGAIEQLYRDDYLKTWRAYLAATSVVPYHSLADATVKLQKIVGNQSPLLSVLCLASTNTSVPDKTLAAAFEPPQSVTPPGCLDHLAAAPNAPYLDALTRLQTSLSQVAANPQNDAIKMQTQADAAQAEAAVLALERTFTVDRQAGIDTKTTAILQAPIEAVTRLLQGLGPIETNGQAKGLCAQAQPLLRKYPFDQRSQIDATLPEVAAFFRQPDGALWSAYAQTFQKLIVRQGSEWTRVAGQSMSVREPFLRWFSRAAAVSDALFRNGTQSPGFTFAVHPVLSEDVDTVTLEINGQAASFTKTSTAAQQFTWPGAVQDVKLQVHFVGGSAFNFPAQQGVWAVFHWLDLAEHPQLSGSQLTFENTLRTTAGPVTIPTNGRAATVKFSLDTMGSALRPGFFSGLSPCVAAAVQ